MPAQQKVSELRAAGKPTVPTTIAEEMQTNPFLRAGSADRFAEVRRPRTVSRSKAPTRSGDDGVNERGITCQERKADTLAEPLHHHGQEEQHQRYPIITGMSTFSISSDTGIGEITAVIPAMPRTL